MSQTSNLSKSGRWIGIAITDSVLELAIFAVPVWILYPINTQRSYKSMILSAFASRLLVVIFAGIHALTAARWAATTPAFGPVEAVLPFLWLNVETNYAIMAATFPTLGLFVKSLNTRWGALDGPDVTQYALESLSESSRTDGRTSRGRKHLTIGGGGGGGDDEDAAPKLRPGDSTYSFRMRSPSVLAREDRSRAGTRESDDSDQMIIRKTVSTSVERGYQEERE
jgi:hypothetical protein